MNEWIEWTPFNFFSENGSLLTHKSMDRVSILCREDRERNDIWFNPRFGSFFFASHTNSIQRERNGWTTEQCRWSGSKDMITKIMGEREEKGDTVDTYHIFREEGERKKWKWSSFWVRHTDFWKKGRRTQMVKLIDEEWLLNGDLVSRNFFDEIYYIFRGLYIPNSFNHG